MRNWLQSFALSFCICLCGCETTDSTIQNASSAKSEVAYVHSYSKFSFPKQIGKFQFVESHEYDRDGKDISVGYNSPTPIAVTIYVYPAAKNFALLPQPALQGVSESLIEHELKNREQEILHFHPNAHFISEDPCEIIQGNSHFKGTKAVYSMAYKFGLSNQDCLSELYIFLIEPGVMFVADNRQYVEYRITYPAVLKDQSEKEISSFLTQLTWPTK
jgi:hypothetical protein